MPDLKVQLLAGTAQQREAQRAWQRVHLQLDAAMVGLCRQQGQALLADGLRLLALRALLPAPAPLV